MAIPTVPPAPSPPLVALTSSLVPPQNLIRANSLVVSNVWRWPAFMGMPTSGALPVARGDPRTHTALLLESIALRHQIAVLQRSRTPRPCFRFWDRLFWVLFSSWWPQWRDSLIILQPQTLLRWRRAGWSALCRYRSRGCWRRGRPRVSREVRRLIVRMARESFLWGAPRIHGELLMLGFSVPQATVSRYMPARSGRPGQSWRTFLCNQAMAFGHTEYTEEQSTGDAALQIESRWAQLKRLTAEQIRRIGAVVRRGLGRSQPALNNRRIGLRSAQCDRAVAHRAASVSGGSRTAAYNPSGAASPIRKVTIASAINIRPNWLYGASSPSLRETKSCSAAKMKNSAFPPLSPVLTTSKSPHDIVFASAATRCAGS